MGIQIIISYPQKEILPSHMKFVRVLHEKEIPSTLPHTTPQNRPEVRQMYPENLFVAFGEKWQTRTWEMNPLLSAGNMTAVYHFQLWVANNNGFGMDGRDGRKYDPRANFFTRQDLTFPSPKVESIICGGNLLRVLGETIVTRGGNDTMCYVVDTLDFRDPPPSLEYMQDHPWLWSWAVNMKGDGDVGPFSQGAQANGYRPGVKHLLLSDRTKLVAIPKWRCVEWTENFTPDPYTMYLT